MIIVLSMANIGYYMMSLAQATNSTRALVVLMKTDSTSGSKYYFFCEKFKSSNEFRTEARSFLPSLTYLVCPLQVTKSCIMMKTQATKLQFTQVTGINKEDLSITADDLLPHSLHFQQFPNTQPLIRVLYHSRSPIPPATSITNITILVPLYFSQVTVQPLTITTPYAQRLSTSPDEISTRTQKLLSVSSLSAHLHRLNVDPRLGNRELHTPPLDDGPSVLDYHFGSYYSFFSSRQVQTCEGLNLGQFRRGEKLGWQQIEQSRRLYQGYVSSELCWHDLLTRP